MLDLRNPFLMPPIKLGYSNGDGKVIEKHTEFYTLRSRYLGAVTLEPLYLDPGLREIPTQLGIDHEDKIPGLQHLIRSIHDTGAKVIAHLNHPGRMANPKIPGNYFLSSSATGCENGGAKPRKMNHDDIMQVKMLFSAAAKRAARAGFDIIELQFGHGYLVAQYLSPRVNDRNDQYGGSFENRIRLAMEILDEVQNAVDLPVIVRISGDEMIPDGFHMDEMIRFTKVLKEKGIEAVHVSAGTVCSTPPWFFQHMFVPKGKTWEMARRIQEEADIPAIFVGKINAFVDIDFLKQRYNAQYIAVGRALVTDPLFLGKYLGSEKGNAKPCLACADGCLGGVKAGTGLRCVVNPTVGFPYTEITHASTVKRIAVVGGGLAGMEAAITLHERGHHVALFEKDRLGGQFNLAWLPPKKESLKRVIDYYVNQLNTYKIKVLKEEATTKHLQQGNYDTVVLATGAHPVIPSIKGLKTYYWTEFLNDDQLPEGKKVVIIGGGLIGLEIASKLVERQNKVYIVEMLEEVGRGMEMMEKSLTLKKLKKNGVEILSSTMVTEVDDNIVRLDTEKNREIREVDHIVLSTGMKPYNPLFDEIKDKFETYVIGDAKTVGKAEDAIRDGYQIGLSI